MCLCQHSKRIVVTRVVETLNEHTAFPNEQHFWFHRMKILEIILNLCTINKWMRANMKTAPIGNIESQFLLSNHSSEIQAIRKDGYNPWHTVGKYSKVDTITTRIFTVAICKNLLVQGLAVCVCVWICVRARSCVCLDRRDYLNVYTQSWILLYLQIETLIEFNMLNIILAHRFKNAFKMLDLIRARLYLTDTIL